MFIFKVRKSGGQVVANLFKKMSSTCCICLFACNFGSTASAPAKLQEDRNPLNQGGLQQVWNMLLKTGLMAAFKLAFVPLKLAVKQMESAKLISWILAQMSCKDKNRYAKCTHISKVTETCG